MIIIVIIITKVYCLATMEVGTQSLSFVDKSHPFPIVLDNIIIFDTIASFILP